MASRSGPDYVSLAKDWAKNSKYKLVSIEENDKKFTFKSSYISFYVYTPENDTEGWNVWSSMDVCITALTVSEVQEFFRSPNRSMHEVLTKAAEVLSKLQYQSQVSTASSTSQTSGEDFDEEEDDGYYQDDDYDIDDDDDDDDDDDMGFENEVKAKETSVGSADEFFTGDGSPAAVHRLLTDFKGMQKTAGKYGVHGRPRNDNLFLWDVELTDFEHGSRLHRDLEHYATTYKRNPVVQMEMKFPKDYPMNPPFVRVVRPRFKFLTGHITVGGSICMQMLTRSGWSPSNDIESILIQVRAEIMSDENAQLDATPDREYSEFEAKDAFERMVRRYGWNK